MEGLDIFLNIGIIAFFVSLLMLIVGVILLVISVVKTVGKEKVQIDVVPGEIVCAFYLAESCGRGINGCGADRYGENKH